ncbi:MAG TPA: 2-oxo acid dehydrogenase subunit E2, partial [Polyangiaceae bacterium]|nr:2-oxo acid dehydrogenase subunit E2 [Polyangiaceae bacterium]
MATTVTMPQLGESIVEGEIGDWKVQEGERVQQGQPLVTILTDKTDTELPAPDTGVIVKVIAHTGDTVEVGAALCVIDANAEASAPSPAVTAPTPTESAEAPAATPSVRKLAREQDVDLAGVTGTGEGGRITHEDVRRAAAPARTAAKPPPTPTPTAAVRTPSPKSGVSHGLRFDPGAFRVPAYRPAPGDEVIPFSRRRRIIADHMVYSKLTSPHVVTFAETDIHHTARLRNAHKNELKKEGISLSYLAFVVAATCKALRETRAMNSRVL